MRATGEGRVGVEMHHMQMAWKESGPEAHCPCWWSLPETEGVRKAYEAGRQGAGMHEACGAGGIYAAWSAGPARQQVA